MRQSLMEVYKKTKKELLQENEELKQQLKKLKSRYPLDDFTNIEDVYTMQDKLVTIAIKILNSTRNGVIITDPNKPDNPAIYCNPAFERITGYSLKDVIGQNCRFLHKGDVNPDELNVLKEAIHSGKDCRVILKNHKKNGDLYWNELVISPIKDDNDRVVNFVGIQNDITERVQIEEELRRSEANLSALIESIDGAIASFDLDFRLISFNRIAEREMNQIGQKLVVGASLEQLLPREKNGQMWENIRQVLKGKHIIQEIKQNFKNGRVAEYEITFNSMYKENMVTGFSIYVRDVTERKVFERKLKKERDKSKQYFDIANLVLLVLDREGGIEKINPKGLEVLGSTESEILGLNWFDHFVPNSQRKNHYNNYLKVIQKKIDLDKYMVTQINTSTGQKYIAWHNSILQKENGYINGVLCSGVDITEQKLMEDTLRFQSEIFKNMGESVCMVRIKDTKIIYTNERFDSMFGYNANELLEKDVQILSGSKSPNIKSEILDNQFIETIKDRKEWRGEVSTKKRDNTFFWCYLRISSFKHSMFANVWIMIFEDISDNIQVLQALQESENRYFSLFQNMQTAFVQYKVVYENEKPVDLLYTEVNPAYLNLLEMNKSDLINKTVFQLFPFAQEMYGDFIQEGFDIAIYGGTKSVEFYADFLDKWLSISIYNVRKNYLAALIDDISERKKTENLVLKAKDELENRVQERTNELMIKTDELIESNTKLQEEIRERLNVEKQIQFFSDAIKTSVDGINITDLDGNIIYSNPASLDIYKFEKEELVGLNVCKLNPDETMFKKIVLPNTLKFGSWKGEVDQKRKDNTIFPAFITSSLIKGSDGELLGIIRIIRDTSAQKKSELELKQAREYAELASKAKSQFLANISHDLRTPLNAIMGYTQILLTTKNLSQNQLKMLSTIQNSSEHLLELLNDILDISKIEAGKIELFVETINLVDFIQTISEIIKIRSLQKGILFESKLDKNLPESISIDKKKLQQILINLLGNAVKFTPVGGVISFEVSILERLDSKVKIRFSIKDTGIGIPEEKIKEIFIPFHQLNKNTNDGVGLGLAICSKLLHLLESQLNVKSKVLEGSNFWFDLDAIETKTIKIVENKSNPIIGYIGERKSILIVDDKLENREILKDILFQLNFDILEAENGRVCIEKSIQLLPDLILMDLMMPEVDGFEATKHLRFNELTQSIPIVAVSANAFSEVIEKSKQIGFNDFLTKPIDLNLLIEKIQTHLQINWIYSEQKHLMDNKSQTISMAQLERLIEYTKSGKIKKIQSELEQMDSNYSSIANEIKEAIATLDFQKLGNYLQTLKGRNDN